MLWRAVTCKLWRLCMGLLPKRSLGLFLGRLAELPLPGPLGPWSVRLFAKAYGIDAAEAERPISTYRSVGEFFARRLRPGARPIGEGVVHPADAVIGQAGRVEAGTLLQAKGRGYTVSALLAGQPEAARFEGGAYLTYYLCPTDYHRVHSPVDGKIVRGGHVPGELWPVYPRSVESVDSLFARNERAYALIETPKGLAAVVMIAAINVANMTLSFDPELDARARAGDRAPLLRNYEPAPAIRRGEEFGVFHLGSTVIVLYEKGVLDADPAAFAGRKSRVGEPLAGMLK